MQARSTVENDPPAPPEVVALWREELERIAPRNEEISWLLIDWVAGDRWETNVGRDGASRTLGIGRWIVWQMVPRVRIPEYLQEDLDGPDPRSFGHWDSTATCQECEGWKADCIVCGGKGRGAWVSKRDSLVSRQQWDLYRRYGCLAKPLWVVQGTQGGHLRRYTEVQSKIAQMNGAPDQPPPPGELPYAEPDRRTWAALGALDNVRKFDLMIDFAERNTGQVEQATYDAMREQMWDYLSNQLEDRLKDERPFLRHVRDNRPAGLGKGPGRDEDALRERFLSR